MHSGGHKTLIFRYNIRRIFNEIVKKKAAFDYGTKTVRIEGVSG